MDQTESKGAKDCRPCDRRRVKCDRGLPTCKKCAKKGLECPGYGLILQWGQGVASRGNLAGKSIPVFQKRKRKSSRSQDKLVLMAPALQGPNRANHAPLLQTQSALMLEEDQLVVACRGLEVVPDFDVRQRLWSFPSPLLENRNIRFFLHHYDQTLAANMAWADCDDNPWRSIMLPMAMQSTSLLFSILAFAAKHMSAMATSASAYEVAIEAARYSKCFGRRALELLAEDLRPSTSAVNSTSIVQGYCRGGSDAVLAAMLVLCNVETVWPDSSVWKVHLNAARTVLAGRSEQETSTNSTVSSFLNQELFVASTFASITTFSNSDDVDPLAKEPGGVFVAFLKLLQKVTRLERQGFSSPLNLSVLNVTPTGLEVIFEQARAYTMDTSSKFKFPQQDGGLQFNRIVNSFYHAGLIYAYRALFKPKLMSNEELFSVLLDINSRIEYSRVELFKILETMEMDMPTYAQNLVFPLFIAGTEASTNEAQQMVVQKLRQAMRGTGFSNCEQAVEFLTALWASRDKNTVQSADLPATDSWIDFARVWSNQGRVFLVF